jgi:hypothetical protein
MNASLTDTLARLGFAALPSRYYGLHSIYDAEGTLIGTFDSYGCWQYLRERGLVGEAA